MPLRAGGPGRSPPVLARVAEHGIEHHDVEAPVGSAGGPRRGPPRAPRPGRAAWCGIRASPSATQRGERRRRLEADDASRAARPRPRRRARPRRARACSRARVARHDAGRVEERIAAAPGPATGARRGSAYPQHAHPGDQAAPRRRPRGARAPSRGRARVGARRRHDAGERAAGAGHEREAVPRRGEDGRGSSAGEGRSGVVMATRTADGMPGPRPRRKRPAARGDRVAPGARCAQTSVSRVI